MASAAALVSMGALMVVASMVVANASTVLTNTTAIDGATRTVPSRQEVLPSLQEALMICLNVISILLLLNFTCLAPPAPAQNSRGQAMSARRKLYWQFYNLMPASEWFKAAVVGAGLWLCISSYTRAPFIFATLAITFLAMMFKKMSHELLATATECDHLWLDVHDLLKMDRTPLVALLHRVNEKHVSACRICGQGPYLSRCADCKQFEQGVDSFLYHAVNNYPMFHFPMTRSRLAQAMPAIAAVLLEYERSKEQPSGVLPATTLALSVESAAMV